MGWAAYQVTRSSGGTKNIIVPKVDSPIEMRPGWFTLSDLISIPDFPIESTIFINSAGLSAAENFGFPNIINVTEFIGERWVFENGNYILFEVDRFNNEQISFNFANNTTYYGTGFIQGACFPTFPPGLVGADKEAIYKQGQIELSGTNIGKFTLYDIANFPELNLVKELKFFDGLTPIVETKDPYDPGGSSGAGGGGGSFDNTSTPIEIPNLPSISAASTGFISLYNPTLNQLNELASYMWSDLFQVDGWKKLFADPMDAILGLSIVPVAVPSGGTREVKVGNIGTGKELTIAASQFVEVDCGSINVNEYWGAYLDYEPYTQAQIFLPYIGTRPISVDEIMGKTVRVVYHVDILTGACCCFVKCGDSVLYTYNGQCSIPIPITGANYASVVNGVISVAASVGSLVATGGSSAPTAIPAIASSAVNQMKPQVEKSGSISGSAGVLNMQTPYLILIRPRQALPSKQNEFIGYPSLITAQLTELKGYTEVQSIHLENIPATQEELAEIESILEGGVIF